MLKMPVSGEHHCHAKLIGGGDDIGVALTASRLNDSLDSSFG